MVALAARRDYAEALLDLANMLSELGRLQKAEEYLQTLVALRPGDATALNNLGVVLTDQGRYAAAIEAYQRALELQPTKADTVRDRSEEIIRHEAGQPVRAMVLTAFV